MTKDNNVCNNKSTIMTRVQVAQSKLFAKNETEGFRELYKLRHCKEAYYPLACYYEQHDDDEKAYAYFEKCQNQYRMALILKRQSKEKKSLEYMTLSANNGNKYAQFMMGMYHQHGLLVKQSIQLAKMWYQRSANQGFAEAQTAISNLLIHQAKDENNTGLIQDALNWLSKAEHQVKKNIYLNYVNYTHMHYTTGKCKCFNPTWLFA
jgi:TPR repeat protein